MVALPACRCWPGSPLTSLRPPHPTSPSPMQPSGPGEPPRAPHRSLSSGKDCSTHLWNLEAARRQRTGANGRRGSSQRKVTRLLPAWLTNESLAELPARRQGQPAPASGADRPGCLPLAATPHALLHPEAPLNPVPAPPPPGRFHTGAWGRPILKAIFYYTPLYTPCWSVINVISSIRVGLQFKTILNLKAM